ncbi:MAG: amino acid permease [Candidatus Thorarchaeota archaeon]|nr:amino acid permease [Candidatus Thorarchaeota archaeon]
MTNTDAAHTPVKRSTVSLKRDVGWFGSFAMGYADVGADIYVALGLVAAYAAGWAPIAFLIASVTYIATGLAYAELSTAYPYAGGAQVYSMKAINDFAGFLAGWLVMLDYTVCIALFAIATTGYLTFFFPWLTGAVVVTLAGMTFEISGIGLYSFIIVLALIGVNIVGIRESSHLNMSMVALNLIVLSAVVILGLVLSFGVDLFFMQLSVRGAPDAFGHIAYLWEGNTNEQNFLYAVTLAMSSFIGIESIAQAAEETKRPDRTIPRATKMSVVSVLVFAVGLSAISVGILPWTVLAANLGAPVSTLAGSIGVVGIYVVPVVAFTGFAICLVSSNTGIIGVSRVVFSMSHFGLLPDWFSKVNTRTRTPSRTIIVFGMIGAAMALIGSLDWVADLYNFGALLSYLMVNVSLILLRQSDKDTYRSWEVPYTVFLRLRGRRIALPIPTVIGVFACGTIWTLVILFHPMGRLLGASWTCVGLLVYAAYRKRKGLRLFSKDLGMSIRPMAYRINAVVFVRPEERDEIVHDIAESLDNRFRITLCTVIRTEKWKLSLQMAEQYREAALSDLAHMAEVLHSLGYETDARAELGSMRSVVTAMAQSSDFDFIVVLSRRGIRKFKRATEDDISAIVAESAPGKMLVIRK